MKKVMLGFGLVIMLMLIGAGYAYVAIFGNQSEFDASSKTFVEQALPQVLSTWSSTALMGMAGGDLQQKVSNSEMGLAFERYSNALGALQSCGRATGKAAIHFSFSDGRMITAHYVADAQFEKGPARISVDLEEAGKGGWRVAAFNIASPVLVSSTLQHY